MNFALAAVLWDDAGGCGGGLLLALVAITLLKIIVANLSGAVSARMLADLRQRIYDHLQSLPLAFHQTHRIQSLEVNYLAEALYGHSVSICTSETEPLHFSHGIMADGADLFRAQTIWTG